MFRYVIEFSKTGTICYISHLDIMRMFKRAFKKAEIRLSYSQGFNPHPKMGFAQPLSLGYEGLEEYIEFETETEYESAVILEKLRKIMPEGIELKTCMIIEGIKKTLAAETEAALYSVIIPADDIDSLPDGESMRKAYLGQGKIVALKKQKKKKEPAEVDIRSMIRKLDISVDKVQKEIHLAMLLDSGSVSNLSPELVITTFLGFMKIKTERSEIRVTREKIFFSERCKKAIQA